MANLVDFRELQLFFSAKESKLQFKTSTSRPILLDTIEYFSSYLEDVFGTKSIDQDRIYINVSTKIYLATSRLTSNELYIDKEA